jgi:hypothetical protein
MTTPIFGMQNASATRFCMNYGSGTIYVVKKHLLQKEVLNFSHIDYAKRADDFLKRVDVGENLAKNKKILIDFLEQRFKTADSILTIIPEEQKLDQELDVFLNTNNEEVARSKMGMEIIKKGGPFFLKLRNVYATMVIENSFYVTYKAIGLCPSKGKNALDNVFNFIGITVVSQGVFENYIEKSIGWNNIATLQFAVSCCFSLALLKRLENVYNKC